MFPRELFKTNDFRQIQPLLSAVHSLVPGQRTVDCVGRKVTLTHFNLFVVAVACRNLWMRLSSDWLIHYVCMM